MTKELSFKDGKDHIVNSDVALNHKNAGDYSTPVFFYFRDERSKTLALTDVSLGDISSFPAGLRHTACVTNPKVDTPKSIEAYLSAKFPDYRLARDLKEFNNLINSEVKKQVKEETVVVEDSV